MQAVQAPMLRPLGVGDVLDRTFTVYRSKPLAFIALSAIWYLLLVLVIVAVTIGLLASMLGRLTQTRVPSTITPTQFFTQFADVIAAVIVFAVIVTIVALVFVSAQSASLVHVGAQRYLGRDVGIGEAFRTGIAATLRMLLAGLVVLLAIVGLWIGLFVVAALTQQGIVFALAVLAALVGTVYLGASWLIYPVVVVVEKLGPIAALGRAWRLSEGHRWRILGIQALLVILNLVLSVLLGVILAVGGQGDSSPAAAFGVGNVLQSLVNFASTILWAPVQWIAFTVLYYDLRVRKEAFDLQLAAEALPQS